MIHGAGAVAQIQHGGQAAGNVGLGPLHRGVQIAAFGQIGGNGAGQGAAGAVGVGVGDAFAVEPFAGAAAPQQVVGVVDLVAALAQHGAAVFLADGLCGSLHAGGVGDGHAGQDLSLRDVGSEHLGHGQQLGGQGLHSVVPQQLGAGSGHHHGVHYDVLCLVSMQLFGNGVDELGRAHHSDLDGIRVDVGEDGIQLLCQKAGRGLKDIGDTGGVLGRQGGDGAHGKHAVGSHGLDVGLDAGTAAGIAAGNGQSGFHTVKLPYNKNAEMPGRGQLRTKSQNMISLRWHDPNQVTGQGDAAHSQPALRGLPFFWHQAYHSRAQDASLRRCVALVPFLLQGAVLEWGPER